MQLSHDHPIQGALLHKSEFVPVISNSLHNESRQEWNAHSAESTNIASQLSSIRRQKICIGRRPTRRVRQLCALRRERIAIPRHFGWVRPQFPMVRPIQNWIRRQFSMVRLQFGMGRRQLRMVRPQIASIRLGRMGDEAIGQYDGVRRIHSQLRRPTGAFIDNANLSRYIFSNDPT